MRFRNLLTPAEINLWDQLFCWLLKIYFCNSFINHKLIELLIKKFDSQTRQFYNSSFIRRNHFLKLKVTIIITINSHYWLQVYQLTSYHVVMQTYSYWGRSRFNYVLVTNSNPVTTCTSDGRVNPYPNKSAGLFRMFVCPISIYILYSEYILQEGPAQARLAINKMYLKDVRASQWPAGVMRAC